MRALSSHFLIIPEQLIRESLEMGDKISKPVGSREYSCTSKVIFSQTPSSDEAGTSFSQTFRAVTKDQSANRFNGDKAYIGLIFTDGSIEIIGSAWETPRISVTPYEGACVVETAFSATSPIIL